MEREPSEKKHKKKHSSKEKHRHRHKDDKDKSKKRRRGSRSSSPSSSGGGDARGESAAQELARLREACAQLRSLLRSFPEVPRRDVRLLLWNVDAGQGVDLSPLPGASCACPRRRASALRCADPALRPVLCATQTSGCAPR